MRASPEYTGMHCNASEKSQGVLGKPRTPQVSYLIIGAPPGTRTPDPLIKSQLL